MSWCRFSTVCDNNKTSELYIYEGDEGVVIHIAARKRAGEENSPKLFSFNPSEDCTQEQEDLLWEKYTESLNERRKWLVENTEFVDIDLPYAGESFYGLPKEEMIALLHELKELGYNFPDYVLEMAEEWEPND